MQSCSPNSTPNLAIVSLPRRKSLWKMVKNMLIPRKLLQPFASCGGIREKRRRRVERLKRGQSLPLERPRRYISRTGSIDAALIPPPPPRDDLIPAPPSCIVSEERLQQYFHELSITSTHSQTFQTASTNADEIIETAGMNSQHNNIHSYVNASRHRSNGSESTEPHNSHTTTNLNHSIQNSPGESGDTNNAVILRNKKRDSEISFDGWRKSSIEVSPEPPITLQYIPSGLQVGDKVMWINDSEPQPERATVRWIGKIRGDYYAGVEFGRKIGNSSGLYGYGLGLFHRLFTCELGFGRFVPVSQLVLSSDFHDKGLKAGFICVICRDDFLEIDDIDPDEDESVNMVATKCGHLYHSKCLKQWIAKTRKKNSSNSSTAINLTPRCPHCQAEIGENDIIKLFPAQV